MVDVAPRAAIALALVAALVWTCLLFGIGLDDLTDGHTKPGVIFAIVALSILMAALLFAILRLVWPQLAKRLGEARRR